MGKTREHTSEKNTNNGTLNKETWCRKTHHNLL